MKVEIHSPLCDRTSAARISLTFGPSGRMIKYGEGDKAKGSTTAENETLEDAVKVEAKGAEGRSSVLEASGRRSKELARRRHSRAASQGSPVKINAGRASRHPTKNKMDEDILKPLVEIEEVTDDEIAEEVKVAGDLRGMVKAFVTSISEIL